MDPFAIERHRLKVERIAAAVRARAEARRAAPGAAGFASIGKAAESHFVPNPRDPRHDDRKIDARDLREVLAIDAAQRTCTAESGVAFCDLVRETLRVGLVPKVVPELKTITIGGAVSGCAVESMSFRHGGFHDGCLEYEVISGRGEVIRCSRERERALFDMIHGSYGTLGIIAAATMELVPARPYVRLENRRCRSFAQFRAALDEAQAAPDVDFIDAIVHGPDALVLCVGRFVAEAPRTSRYDFLEIFHRSTLEKPVDHLATEDYFFRYDADCHWMTNTIPGMTTRLGRLLAGKLLLGSTNLLAWSRRLRRVLRLQRRPPVVTDLFVPARRFEEFYAWYAREVAYYPLWVVPYRTPGPYPWLADEHVARLSGETLFLDCAVYGLRNDEGERDWYEVFERRMLELGGLKALISPNRYDEKTFWSIWSRERHLGAKERMDPENLFRDLYEKFGFEGRARAAVPAVPVPSTAPAGVGR